MDANSESLGTARKRIPCRSGVYEILNVVNGKRYVGSAVNMSDRVALHKMDLRRGNHHSSKLQRAWNKYGAEKFSFRPLLECARHDLLMYEQRAIDIFAAAIDGYNILQVAGSNLGKKMSDETRRKLSVAHTGKKMSLESREKMRLANLGRHHTDETRSKISKTMIGHKKPQSVIDALLSRPVSMQTRAKISQSLMGHSYHPRKGDGPNNG